MRKNATSGFILLLVCSMWTCTKEPIEPIKIGINPWPGYEFLYLADQLGFYDEVGLPVKIVQYSSLADVQRAFMMGQVDGMTTTGIELVIASYHSNKKPKVVLVADYSNGGDVIIGAADGIESMADLRGKKIGLELNSLGLFMLARGLEVNGMSLEDVEPVNVEVIQLPHALREGDVVAGIAYPPTSIEMMTLDHAKVLFDSTEIPEEVVDVVSVSEASLGRVPDFIPKLRQVWDRALAYSKSNPKHAYEIMAARERITPKEFEEALSGVIVLSGSQQDALMKDGGKLEKTLVAVEDSLRSVGILKEARREMDYFYRGTK